MRKKSWYHELGFAKVDYLRSKRKGFPEVIYCENKIPSQVAKIAKRIAASGHDVLASRADKKTFLSVKNVLKKARYHEAARVITLQNKKPRSTNSPIVAIVSAGTADLPVAEEAAVVAEFLGELIYINR